MVDGEVKQSGRVVLSIGKAMPHLTCVMVWVICAAHWEAATCGGSGPIVENPIKYHPTRGEEESIPWCGVMRSPKEG